MTREHMRRSTQGYWRRATGLTDDERRKLRSYGATVTEIGRRLGMAPRTIEELTSYGGVVVAATVERVRQRMAEVDDGDDSTHD